MSKQYKEKQYVRKKIISKRIERQRNPYWNTQGYTPKSYRGRAKYGVPNHTPYEKRNRRIG